MKTILLSLAAALLFASPGKGLAGWDKVKWGATVEDIKAAYGDQISEGTRMDVDDTYCTLTIPKHVFGMAGMQVSFYMNKKSHKLQMVTMYHTDELMKEENYVKTLKYKIVDDIKTLYTEQEQPTRKTTDTKDMYLWTFKDQSSIFVSFTQDEEADQHDIFVVFSKK